MRKILGWIVVVAFLATSAGPSRMALAQQTQTQQQKTTSTQDIILYLLGGLGLYLLLHHHTPTPTTTSRPTSEPSSQPSPSPSPTSSPQPINADTIVTHGHDGLGCEARLVDAWMEPTQGVWQDDVAFPDQKTKQLVRDPDAERILYHAELPMVADRDTVIGGVDHYRLRGELVDVRDRNDVVFKVRTNCTQSAPLHVHFEVRQAVLLASWDDDHKFQVPIGGKPATQSKLVDIRIPAEDGLPSTGTFKFESGLAYSIVAKLVEPNGEELGLDQTVDGGVVQTEGFAVHFVPVILSAKDVPDADLLRQFAQYGAEDTRWVNEYYPERPGAIYGVLEPSLNVTDKNIPDVGSWSPVSHANWVNNNRNQALLDAITDRLGVQTLLENGGRVVAVVTDGEFYKTFNPAQTAGAYTARSKASLPAYERPGLHAGGQAVSYKFIIEPWSNTGTGTTAHELAHTLVPGWMDGPSDQTLPAMETQCKTKSYHDVKVPWAFGLRLNKEGKHVREPKRARFPMMSWPLDRFWTAQCTYWRLLDTLAGFVPDPRLILVRGSLARRGPRTVGRLGPAYDLNGAPSIAHEKGGPYRIILRDDHGKKLAAYFFAAPWKLPEAPIYRTVVPFAYTVPAPSGTATVELDGPGGRLDTLQRAAAPPVANIRSVRRNGHLVDVTWNAPVGSLSTLLYSANGRDFVTETFETTSRNAQFRAPAGGILKLLVSRGARSVTIMRRM